MTSTLSAVSKWKPHVLQPPTEWVKRNIYFSAKEGIVAGYWSVARFPYSTEVLETFADPSIQEIVLSWGTQLGKTSLLGAYVCYIAVNDPAPLMIACSDIRAAHEHYRTKLEPMLESCPLVKSRMLQPYERSMELVDLHDMWIYYAWSGGKATLSGRSVRYLLITEINLHTYEKNREGDPVRMARDRTKAFPNRKIFIEGKPNVVGDCRITSALRNSDQRTYHVPCPHCHHYQVLELGTQDSPGGLKWSKSPDGASIPSLALKTTYYQCENCQAKLYERDKLLMLRSGLWVKAGQSVVNLNGHPKITGDPLNLGKIAGFHLPSLYSTLLTWGEVAEEYLKAKAGTQADLQAFYNGWLALPWQQETRLTSHEEVLSHIGDYHAGSVPGESLGLICTVDVQELGMFFVIRAWSYHATSWLIRFGFIESFAQLDDVLSQSYRSLDGNISYRVKLCLIDCGYRTSEVYEYCAKRFPFCQPMRGESSNQYRQTAMVTIGKVPDLNLPVWRIDSGQAFDQLFERRLRIKPTDAGGWQIYSNIEGDYVKGLCCWVKKQEKTKTGFLKYHWESLSRNYEHSGDLEKYQEAAAFHYGFSFINPPSLSVPSNPNPNEIPKLINRDSNVVRSDGRSWLDR